jgi:lysine 2,3-aminomutase
MTNASRTSRSRPSNGPERATNAAGGTRERPLRTADDLANGGLIAPADAPIAAQVARRYAVAVPGALADTVRNDPSGALKRQFVPSADELVIARDELADPIGDEAHSPVKGIVHRYPDRVLLKPLHACAVYCRFCFRREQVGPGGDVLTAAETATALAYIRRNPGIWEVILSGGDPLLLAPRRLKALVRDIAAIDHVGVIRVHTRLPVADPARITPALVRALRCEKAVYVVLHCNHAAELTPAATAAAARLIDAGIPMLAQSVLLRGVNDDPETLETLLRALTARRIKPYYLHHPDRARGTGHFRLPIAAGRALMRHLRGRLSGLAQPTYVLDIPGGHGKVPVGPDYLRPGAADGEWIVTDPAGRTHAYRDGGQAR